MSKKEQNNFFRIKILLHRTGKNISFLYEMLVIFW